MLLIRSVFSYFPTVFLCAEQVKSKVVVPGSTKTICKPVVLSSEDEWERNKRTYVDSVKRHMKEQNGAANGITLYQTIIHVFFQVCTKPVESAAGIMFFCRRNPGHISILFPSSESQ